MDSVKCSWCGWTGLVETGSDTCLRCGSEGHLVDIEEEDIGAIQHEMAIGYSRYIRSTAPWIIGGDE